MRLIMLIGALLILACGEDISDKNLEKNTEQKKYVSLLHRLADSTQTYQIPSIDNKINFPEAHSPKKNYRHEWWYITANLVTDDGDDIAMQWTLFRTAIKGKHWYFAHAALGSDKQHLSAFRNAREELGNLTITNNPFSASIDDWQWLSSSELLPAKLNFADFKDDNQWQVKLDLQGANQFYLQGAQGYNRKHAQLLIASHYYSQPFIKASGRIFLDGEWHNVTGNAWFDREWGSQMLAPEQQGWDWFSLRLKPELALMVYRIRSDNKDFIYASLMHDNGDIETLTPDEVKLISIISTVQSTYPNHFKIIIKKHEIDIDVKTINKDQIMRFGIEYFEGMVNFTGSHTGIGFLEMTGY